LIYLNIYVFSYVDNYVDNYVVDCLFCKWWEGMKWPEVLIQGETEQVCRKQAGKRKWFM